MKCRFCNSEKVKRSRRQGIKEGLFLRLLLGAPFRCPECGKRYYACSLRSGFQRRRPPKSVSEYIGLSGKEELVQRWIIHAVVTILLLAVTLFLMFRMVKS